MNFSYGVNKALMVTLGIDDIETVQSLCLHGGCYIFAKKFQKMFGGILYYSENKEHCIIFYKNHFYDTTGVVHDIKGYKKCNDCDEEYMIQSYGLDYYFDCDMSWLLT